MSDDFADLGQQDDEPTETIEAVVDVPRAGERGTAAGLPGVAGFALIVASGPRRGLHWSLPDGATRIGRDPEDGIFLDDVTVSRHHAELAVSDDRLVLRDLGSTNGTYVNGSRHDEVELRSGDEVIIGRFHLVIARGS